MGRSLDKTERAFKSSKDEIHHFEGLEGVRHRPTMYLGSCGEEGLHHCVLEIVHNSVDEFLFGSCKNIHVTLHNDDSVTVEDDGRGIPVKKHTKSGISQLELALTKLHAGSKFFQNSSTDKFSSGLNGVGASCVNALSTKFEASVFRDGGHYRQRYECGVKQCGVKRVGKSSKTGTKITFKPDDEIFETTEFDVETLVEILDDLAFLNAGLRIHFHVEEREDIEATTVVYQHKDGVLDYLKWITEDHHRFARDTMDLRSNGKMDDKNGRQFAYKIEASFTYVDDTDKNDLRTFVNNVRTTEGGTHEDGFIQGLGRAVTKYAKDNNMVRGIKTLKQSDVTDSGLFGVLSFYMHEPRFASQTKRKLTNHEVTKIVSDLTNNFVAGIMEENPSLAKKLVQQAVESAKRREKIESIKKVKKTDALTSATKLADCITRDPEQAELWLVEGDSAGGSAKTARDTKFQAILPLKGKILNVERATVAKMAKNDEVSQIIQAIGTGIGTRDDYSSFALEDLAYNKVIIACDADCDGGHIAVLLITFFWKYMRPLIEEGRLYIAQPPLYEAIKRGRSLKVFRTHSHYERWVTRMEKKGKSLKGVTFTRYKGLGEMNPEKLWATTMNPETRVLARLTVEDGEECSSLIELLMSEAVEPRREFIENNAHLATIDA